MLLFVGPCGDTQETKESLGELLAQATGSLTATPNHTSWQAAGRAYDELVRNREDSAPYLAMADQSHCWG